MRLTTRGRFAVTALLDVALQCSAAPVALADISRRQDISLSYLEQLFGKLRRGGLVESVRGPGGGYRLARDPGLMSVADIISAVDESFDATLCGGRQNCRDGRRCMTHSLWDGLNQKVLSYLVSVTLQELVRRSQTRPVRVVKGCNALPVRELPKATGAAAKHADGGVVGRTVDKILE